MTTISHRPAGLLAESTIIVTVACQTVPSNADRVVPHACLRGAGGFRSQSNKTVFYLEDSEPDSSSVGPSYRQALVRGSSDPVKDEYQFQKIYSYSTAPHVH